MLFYNYEGCLCAYIRNRGFVCVDANSPRFDEPLPAHFDLTTCDDAAPYTNPYGDILLTTYRVTCAITRCCRSWYPRTGRTCSRWKTVNETLIRRCFMVV